MYDEIAIARLAEAYDRKMSLLFGGCAYDPEDEQRYAPLFAGAAQRLDADAWRPERVPQSAPPADWADNWESYFTDEELGRTADGRERIAAEIEEAYAE